MKKYILSGCLALMAALSMHAQGGTNSPYSQYGLGTLADMSQGHSRGMNGASLGLRQGNTVNTVNPASYSAIDSLTMIFDVGLSGQITNFKENGSSLNARNASFEYAVGSFRLLPHVGMTFGILPYSNIGYNYSSSTYLDSNHGTMTQTYKGEGGLRQVFLGAGWQLFPGMSIGVNVGYLWGTLERSVQSSSNTYIFPLLKSYTSSVNSYKIDFGAQYQKRLNAKNLLTVGATVGIGHKLGADAVCQIIENSTDTTTQTVGNALSLPMTYAVGVAWSHGRQWVVDADFSMQKWGDMDFPGDMGGSYTLQSGLLKDRYQVKVGADYVPNRDNHRNFLERVHYRFGVGYATPYYNINGKEGPKEFSVSAGFGIPLQNQWNNRSVLNVSAQWVHTSATGLITENTFRINVGLTFNERWFSKWKIE